MQEGARIEKLWKNETSRFENQDSRIKIRNPIFGYRDGEIWRFNSLLELIFWMLWALQMTFTFVREVVPVIIASAEK
ncbi:unnamed protein product [Lactuca virosa]|uniref:Uncharacterized protein n=1 Tax=Lactuca virosa TaxID=75947 RepID=A0AAU9M864_9ASTR|nr:unnamed protein product [Lactuca virosa]